MQLPITPYKVKKGILYWKHFGTKEFMNRLMERMEPEEVPYGPWFSKHRADYETLARQKKMPILGGPLVSLIVPAWHTPPQYLTELIDSVLAQSYDRWELIIADAGASDASEGKEKTVAEVCRDYMRRDGRIRYVPLPENYGIAENTNAGIRAAEGSYVGFIDHDDFIEPNALYEIASAISEVEVKKVGFERTVEKAANEWGLTYGLLAVLLSVGMGWGAGRFFARV